MRGWLLVTEDLEDLEQTRQYLEDQELEVRVLPHPSEERTRYDDFLDHPLCGVDANILKVVRDMMQEVAEIEGDRIAHLVAVSPALIEPIADAVVMRLRKAGWLP